VTRHTITLGLGLLLGLVACGDDLLDRDGDGQASDEAGGTDCDDSDPSVYLGAEERCGNSQDDDCDGEIDEDGTGSRTFYADLDRDDFGDPRSPIQRCEAGDGVVEDNTDCDDTQDDVNPDMVDDTCDDRDDDCNGRVDDKAEQRMWYRDSDGDGYGVDVSEHEDCEAPEDYVETAGDCDDRDPAIHPDAPELCNGDDDDCDGDEDEGILGDGAACPADSCLQVHTLRPDTGNEDFWINNRLDPSTPVQVRCVELPRDGRGWMAVDLPWLKEWEWQGFDKGGDAGAFGEWVDGVDTSDQPEPEVLLDTAFNCHRRNMRWIRFRTDLPVEFTEVTGMFGMVSDPAGRAADMPWYGVDNVPRTYGGTFQTYRECGQGAVLFGSEKTIVKTGGDWGTPWGRADSTLCPGVYYDTEPLMCERWAPPRARPVAEGSGQLRWELHGSVDGHNSAARISIIDVYVR